MDGFSQEPHRLETEAKFSEVLPQAEEDDITINSGTKSPAEEANENALAKDANTGDGPGPHEVATDVDSGPSPTPEVPAVEVHHPRGPPPYSEGEGAALKDSCLSWESSDDSPEHSFRDRKKVTLSPANALSELSQAGSESGANIDRVEPPTTEATPPAEASSSLPSAQPESGKPGMACTELPSDVPLPPVQSPAAGAPSPLDPLQETEPPPPPEEVAKAKLEGGKGPAVRGDSPGATSPAAGGGDSPGATSLAAAGPAAAVDEDPLDAMLARLEAAGLGDFGGELLSLGCYEAPHAACLLDEELEAVVGMAAAQVGAPHRGRHAAGAVESHQDYFSSRVRSSGAQLQKTPRRIQRASSNADRRPSLNTQPSSMTTPTLQPALLKTRPYSTPSPAQKPPLLYNQPRLSPITAPFFSPALPLNDRPSSYPRPTHTALTVAAAAAAAATTAATLCRLPRFAKRFQGTSLPQPSPLRRRRPQAARRPQCRAPLHRRSRRPRRRTRRWRRPWRRLAREQTVRLRGRLTRSSCSRRCRAFAGALCSCSPLRWVLREGRASGRGGLVVATTSKLPPLCLEQQGISPPSNAGVPRRES